MRWMFMPLRRYARFSGRASRREFWPWIAFMVAVITACIVLNANFGDRAFRSGRSSTRIWGDFAIVFAFFFWLGTFLPSLAVAVRRLHDMNNRGWWVLLIWVPFAITLFFLLLGNRPLFLTIGGGGVLATLVGTATLLIWCIVPGTRGDNRFGKDPFGATLEDLSATFE